MLCRSNWYKSSKLSPKVWVHTRTSTSTNQVLQVYCSANVNSIVHRHSLEDYSTILLLKAGSHMRSDQGDQGSIQASLENLQGWRLHNFSGQPVPLSDCPSGEKPSSLYLVGIFHVSLWPLLLIMHVHEWLCFPSNFPIGIGKLPLGCPKALTSLGYTSPVSFVSPFGLCAPTIWPSWWPSAGLAQAYKYFSYTRGDQNWMHYSRCGLMSTK